MLLEFKVKNYKSFKDEGVLSLIPAPKQKDLEYSVLSQKIGNRVYKALATSVIYGANASGKTNIIGAIESFVNIINNGNLKNSNMPKSHNYALSKLELIPNKDLTTKETVDFYISFINDNTHIEYDLKIDLGLFFEFNYPRKVIYEELKVNGLSEFIREKNNLKQKNKDNFKTKEITKLLEANLDEDELFLTNGFKNLINNQLVETILNYLNQKLIVIYRTDSINLSRRYNDENNQFKVDSELSEAANEIGALNSNIGFYSLGKEQPSRLTTGIKVFNQEKGYLIPSEMIESYGTIRFLNIFPLIKGALATGSVLIADEFDASIHPMVLLDIVNIFHNNEINVNNAQLIFNTHNPILLSSSILRRDEIKFVEKDENGSIIYALSDFKTAGDKGVRKTEDYMKHYFVNKYGGILDVDLSELFSPEVKDEKEN